jgi:hypothetical protein
MRGHIYQQKVVGGQPNLGLLSPFGLVVRPLAFRTGGPTGRADDVSVLLGLAYSYRT